MARLTKTKKELIFNVRDAFTNPNKLIGGTVLISNKEYTDFYSIKNTKPNPILGKICAKPAYEIVTAIRDIQKNSNILCVGREKKEGGVVYIGTFHNEEKEDMACMIYPTSGEIYTTSPEENNVYSLIAVMNMMEFMIKGKEASIEDAEIFQLMDKMKFSSTIDSDQNDVFIPLVDSIYFEAKKMNGFKVIPLTYDDITEKIFSEINVKYNLMSLINEKEPLSLDGVKIPIIEKPSIKGGKSFKRKKTTSTVDYASEDYSILSDEEASRMPKSIQMMREKAIKFFEDNKQFLSEEQWSVIKSFKRGRLWKAGFYGPSATGKTSFVKCLAGALKVPYAVVVGSKGMDETKLFGKYILKDGETVFEDGPLTEMMRYGGLFLLDEENMVSPEVISSMNSVLDDTRLIVLDSNEIVHCHKNFRYCEAMNIAYAGTLEQNLSHESRVQLWLKFKGYSDEKESEIVAKETGIDKDIALKMINIKNKAMEYIEAEGDDTTQRVDLRSVISWADKTIDCDGDVIKASLTTIMAPLVKEDDSVTDSATVESFENSKELASSIIEEIKATFKRVTQKTEFEFEKYEI